MITVLFYEVVILSSIACVNGAFLYASAAKVELFYREKLKAS